MKTRYVKEAAPKFRLTPPKSHLDSSGPQALSDIELVSILLHLPEEEVSAIFEKHTLPELIRLNPEEMQEKLGQDRAHVFLAAFEITRRALKEGIGIRPLISCPAETVPLLTDIADKKKEHFLCLYLNARNQVIHKEVISIGSLSASIVHPRELFSVALQHTAASVIIAHNHPSGDPSASREDIELTRRLAKAGEIMGVEVLDHIIVSQNDFASLKEQGIL